MVAAAHREVAAVLAIVQSAIVFGVDGHPVTVEVHISSGLPGFTVVGLPDTACREARDRVRAALMSSDLPWPSRRVTVNLAPSGVRKTGAGLDLAIAVGLLGALGEIPADSLRGCAFLGELALDGSLRRIPAVVSLVDSLGAEAVVVPAACGREAALLGRHVVRPATSLSEVVHALRGDAPWPEPPTPVAACAPPAVADLADVRGQAGARLALEVSAAGGHHLLMVGPPGGGKTMLAERLPGLLPPLPPAQALDVARVHSAAGLELPPAGVVEVPPFRAPHHTASAAALVGGGSTSRPGEISCAHRGVLFLDELGEFQPSVLDALRQPLEEGVIRVARAKQSLTFPARFLLVAALNPCPCGEGVSPNRCSCSDAARLRYERRLSGPLLDRFDLRITVHRPEAAELLGGECGESSAAVAERVAQARQIARSRGFDGNAHLPASTLDELAPLTDRARSLLRQRLEQGGLSARGLHRVRRVARTVADLRGVDVIDEGEVSQALVLRAPISSLDRWAA